MDQRVQHAENRKSGFRSALASILLLGIPTWIIHSTARHQAVAHSALPVPRAMLGNVDQEAPRSALGRLHQVQQFVNNHIFEQVFRFLNQLGIQTNDACAIIAAAHLVFMRCRK